MLRLPVSALRTVDLVVRLMYCAIAPFTLVIMVTLFPIMGVVVNMALALLVFAFAAVVRAYVDRFPLLGKVFGKQLQFESFYREHPPKPFLYYLFYPLMLPYVAFNRVAQRELGLYRGLTTLGIVLLVFGAFWDYFRKWQPDLGFRAFAGSWVGVLVIQAIISIALVMPLTTTVVTLRLQQRTGALVSALVIATLATAAAIVGVVQKRHDTVQLPTQERMYLRTMAEKARSREVRIDGLERALVSIKRGDAETFKQPKATEIMGGPIIDSRDSLLRLYKQDETECFHLVAFKTKRGATLVLFGVPTKKRALVWLGMRSNGDVVDDADELPSDAIATMWRIAKR